MKTILVTGASGEVGTGLIEKLSETDDQIIALDINDLGNNLSNKVNKFYKLDISNEKDVNNMLESYNFDIIFHLAALLSTSAEKDPGRAHVVNAGGTFNLLSAANKQAGAKNKIIKFIFPSTIAVYGMGSLKLKAKHKKVDEDQFLDPITMYGVNKLYCENLGKYYSTHFSQLSNLKRFLDFRSVRFPGLLSAFTLPTGGTSDYAPEMVHAAAKRVRYSCFVRPDTQIGFMAMPDAVDSLMQIANAQKSKLTSSVYNIAGFSASARDFENEVKRYYPKTLIDYKIDAKRQRIVDSWPMDTNDSKARKDWVWKPKYNLKNTFSDYLIPNIR